MVTKKSLNGASEKKNSVQHSCKNTLVTCFFTKNLNYVHCYACDCNDSFIQYCVHELSFNSFCDLCVTCVWVQSVCPRDTLIFAIEAILLKIYGYSDTLDVDQKEVRKQSIGEPF